MSAGKNRQPLISESYVLVTRVTFTDKLQAESVATKIIKFIIISLLHLINQIIYKNGGTLLNMLAKPCLESFKLGAARIQLAMSTVRNNLHDTFTFKR